MFGSMGFTELILILFIVLIIFGAGKLPQLGEGLGKAIKGFKKSVHEADAIEAEAEAAAQQQMATPQASIQSSPAPANQAPRGKSRNRSSRPTSASNSDRFTRHGRQESQRRTEQLLSRSDDPPGPVTHDDYTVDPVRLPSGPRRPKPTQLSEEAR